MNSKALVLIPLLLAGCQHYQQPSYTSKNINQKPTCEYMERNLTVPWVNRRYFCLPEDYRGHIKVRSNEILTE